MPPPALTLIVPELLWPEPEDRETLEQLPCPALESLLAANPLQARPGCALEDLLLRELGGSPHNLAALRRLGEDDAPAAALSGAWLCADPVHLRFHQERIILADSRAFQLRADEAQALVSALNPLFADIGQFAAPHPERWYLQLQQPLPCPHRPLSEMAGRKLDADLEQSGSPALRQLQNEIQMVLHQHPLNRERESRGEPTINSLWLWGDQHQDAGAAPCPPALARHPLALGLARAAGVPASPPPADLASLLQAGPLTGSVVLLDSLLTPSHYEDGAAWRQALVELEQRWFAPLQAQLGRIGPVRLLAPCLYGCLEWTLSRRRDWRFWQRPASLATLARRLVS